MKVWDLFTPDEQRTAELLLEGMGNQEIASSLNIALRTVKQRLNRMFMKAGLNQSKNHKRIELVVKLFRDPRK